MDSSFNVSDHHKKEFWEQQKSNEKEAKKLDQTAAQQHTDTLQTDVDETLNQQTETEEQTTTQSQASSAQTLKSITKSTISQASAVSPYTNLNAQGSIGKMNQPVLTAPNDPTAPFPQIDVKGAFTQALNQMTSRSPQDIVPKAPVDPSIPVTDPDIIAYAQNHGITPQEAQAQIMNAHLQTFTMAASQSASPLDVQKLLYAYANPSNVANLPPNLQQLFSQLMGKSNQAIATTFQLPQGWNIKQTNSPSLTSKMANAYANGFEAALKLFAKTNGLTQNQVNTLRGMFYNGESGYASDPQSLKQRGLTEQQFAQLPEALQTVQEQASQTLTDQFGAPPGTKATPNSDFYNAEATGKFREEFAEGLTKHEPPLTPEQIEQAIHAYEHPEDRRNMPIQIVALVNGLKEKTLADIKAAYGLPDEWNPPLLLANKKGDAAQNAFATQTTKKGIKQVQQMISHYEKHFKEAAATALGPTILNFYKTLGEALDILSRCIYAIMGADTSVAKTMCLAQMDMKINQINIRRGQIEKAMRDIENQKSSGLRIFLEVISFAIVLLVAIVLVPVTAGASLVAAIFFIIDQVQANVRGVQSLTEKFFETIIDMLGESGGWLNLFLSILLSGGNPLLALTLIFNTSHAVEDIAKSFGASDQAAAIINMVVQLVVMVVILVACIVAPELLGVELAEAMTAIGSFVAETLQAAFQAAGMTAQLAKVIVDIVMMLPELLQIGVMGLQAYSSVITIVREIKLARLSMLMAEVEADMVEMTNMINILKKIIAQILDSLSGSGDWLKSVQAFQSSKYNQASALTTQIVSAY